MELSDGGTFCIDVNHSRSAVVKTENRLSHSVGAISIERTTGFWYPVKDAYFYFLLPLQNTVRPKYTTANRNTPLPSGRPASIRTYDQVDKMRIK
jgi:hypothetical protein